MDGGGIEGETRLSGTMMLDSLFFRILRTVSEREEQNNTQVNEKESRQDNELIVSHDDFPGRRVVFLKESAQHLGIQNRR